MTAVLVRVREWKEDVGVGVGVRIRIDVLGAGDQLAATRTAAVGRMKQQLTTLWSLSLNAVLYWKWRGVFGNAGSKRYVLCTIPDIDT